MTAWVVCVDGLASIVDDSGDYDIATVDFVATLAGDSDSSAVFLAL